MPHNILAQRNNKDEKVPTTPIGGKKAFKLSDIYINYYLSNQILTINFNREYKDVTICIYRNGEIIENVTESIIPFHYRFSLPIEESGLYSIVITSHDNILYQEIQYIEL